MKSHITKYRSEIQHHTVLCQTLPAELPCRIALALPCRKMQSKIQRIKLQQHWSGLKIHWCNNKSSHLHSVPHFCSHPDLVEATSLLFVHLCFSCSWGSPNFWCIYANSVRMRDFLGMVRCSHLESIHSHYFHPQSVDPVTIAPTILSKKSRECVLSLYPGGGNQDANGTSQTL